MKKLIVMSMLFGISVCSFGQQAPGALSVSLEQAIQTGLKNRYDLQSKKYNKAIAASEVDESREEWLVDISASGNIRYAPELQSTFVPGGFITDEPALVSLGAKSTAMVGLDLNQTIYKPGIATDIKIAKNNLELAQEKIREDENTVHEQIVFAYLSVLLRDLQVKIAADEERRYMEYEAIVEGKFKIGIMLENDYLKAKLDYENTKVEHQKTQQNYALALTTLQYQMNVPSDVALVLTDSINSPQLNNLQISMQHDPNKRTEVKQLMLKQESNKLWVSRAKQYALPTISLYGNYSPQYAYTNLDLTQTEWWTASNYVGVRMSLPLTGSFKNRNNIDIKKYNQTQTELDLKQKVADVNYEIEKAYTELEDSKQNLQTTKNNYDLSKKIYENQDQQYQLGAREYTDILETERSLKTTEENYVFATYNFLVSNINYQKAIGW